MLNGWSGVLFHARDMFTVWSGVGMTFQFHVRDMLNGWSGVSCFMYETCLLFGPESV